jgi:hypothetical protein
VNSLVGFFFTEYDSAAQTLPDYMQITEFLAAVRETHHLFWSFSYVCPEPVLAK